MLRDKNIENILHMDVYRQMKASLWDQENHIGFTQFKVGKENLLVSS